MILNEQNFANIINPLGCISASHVLKKSDCIPGRGGMAQDGGTGGGAFHGEMDRRREVKAGVRHVVVCPNVTERTK